jgi:HSP20 family protein
MTLRGDPLQELLELQERINRLFEETLGGDRLDEPQGMHGGWVPAADVFEAAECYVVELELPGVAKDEITVHAHGGELVVRGERQAFPVGRPDSFHRLERRHGPFGRSFRFTDPIDASGIGAELTDGLLRIRVPKSPAASGRRVPVERSAKTG